MGKVYIRHSERLTTIAKKIFGEFVLSVFFITEDYDEMYGGKPAQPIDRLNLIESNSERDGSEECLIFDDCNIGIKFNNDNIIVLGSSEWGSVEKFSDCIIGEV